MIHGDMTSKKDRMKKKGSPSKFLSNLSAAVKDNKNTKEYKSGLNKALNKAKKGY